ncbi:MAG: DUF4160 domain-containing protein [Atopobiaceae bacterium]|nr:DUF4160 domain-containing protein [Atopobiaceae bacterium]
MAGTAYIFWSSEEGEPVHVHVAKGRPTPDATKLWLTSAGGCVLAHNKGKIPSKDLKAIERIVAAQHDMICREWRSYFDVENVSFLV